MRAFLMAAVLLASAGANAQPASGPAPAPIPPPAQSGARLAPGQPIPPDQLEALVDGVANATMAHAHIAGAAVAVVQNGQVVLKKGYGFAGPGRPVDPDRTLFRIASISKTFTWIAALKEVEAGRMALDAPINRYLPPDDAVPDAAGWRQVELRDLMTHTPGFEDRTFDHLFTDKPSKIRPLETQLRLARPRRVFAPGTTPAYSNYGAALTGEAVSRLEGAPYQSVIEREILGPLGMAHTTFREPYPARADLPAPMATALAADRSVGYRWSGDTFEPQTYEYITQGAPAGAGSSTAGDMARYMLAILGDGQLDGARIYGPQVAAALRTPLPIDVKGAPPVDHGFFEYELPGGFIGHGHDGDTIWFHSTMVTIPQLGLGIFVTTNTSTGPALTAELPGRIVERFYAPPQPFPRPGSPQLGAHAAVYAGTYLTNRRPFTGLEKFVYMLIGGARIGVTPDGRLTAPGPGGLQVFAPDGPPGHFHAVSGSDVTDFELAGGRAVRWYPLAVISYDRVGPLYQATTLGLVGCLAVLAIVAVLVGPALRFRRDLPQTAAQRTLTLLQIAASLAWLACFVGLALFASKASNQAEILYTWPSPTLVAGSIAALVAALLSAAGLVLAAFAWRSSEGWGVWRKLRTSMTALVFAALALQLGLWGLLEPWNT
ncbi:MAG TPA: serine hydrolase domain-containing protein [Caulobacteraceae bacterium]|nr:serine hydrolase domain-containing protein [Caulobacteraceae bacterium]